MFLVKRIYQVQPGKARQAATILDKIGKAYEEAGTRSASTVYFNSGTTPGDKDTVVMEWTEESLGSTYREDRIRVDTSHISGGLGDISLGSRIEFWELLTEEKYI